MKPLLDFQDSFLSILINKLKGATKLWTLHDSHHGVQQT